MEPGDRLARGNETEHTPVSVVGLPTRRQTRSQVDQLDPAEIPGMLRALGIFEKLGRMPAEEAADWRRTILDRWGLPTADGSA